MRPPPQWAEAPLSPPLVPETAIETYRSRDPLPTFRTVGLPTIPLPRSLQQGQLQTQTARPDRPVHQQPAAAAPARSNPYSAENPLANLIGVVFLSTCGRQTHAANDGGKVAKSSLDSLYRATPAEL